MKVAITSRCLFKLHGYGGMERYVYSFSKHLAKNDIDVKMITSSPKNKCKFEDFSEFKNLEIIYLDPDVNGGNRCVRPILYRIFLRNIAKYLRKNKVDIVHSFGICPPDYLRLKGRSYSVVQPFGSEEFKSRNSEFYLKKFYLDIFMRNPKRYSIQNADAIASEGDLQTQEIIDLFKVPKDKIFYLPDGVDLDEVEGYVENTKITREDFSLQDADLVLMNVNRLVSNKGVPYLIDALKYLNGELNVKLILVGSGPEESKIKEMINELGLEEKILHFKDITDKQIFQLYTLADISITPTLYEGLPLVVLEAMACGKPIVASNVSEVPQVVKNGINGFLVPPRDSRAIADKVLNIYERDLFRTMGENSKKIVEDYDWSRIAKMAIKKYEELIK